jgi:hypothetical protein
MSEILFFTDENIHGELADILRSHGFNAVSTPEADRLSEPDPVELEWCQAEGRCNVTFNVGDYANLHCE